MKTLTILSLALSAFLIVKAETDKPVHLFVLSGQSNMQGMDPETGFMTEAKKLFKDEKVVYIKVAKGGQPICRWLEEWQDIAKKNGLGEKDIKGFTRVGRSSFISRFWISTRRCLRSTQILRRLRFAGCRASAMPTVGGSLHIKMP